MIHTAAEAGLTKALSSGAALTALKDLPFWVRAFPSLVRLLPAAFLPFG